METDKVIDRLRELGYEVGVTMEGYGGDRESGGVPTVYRVEGFGLSTQIGADDEKAWSNLANAKAHEHREKSARSSDPDDDFEWTEEEQFQSSLEAAVGTGGMDRKEATAALKQWRENREEAPA